MSKDHDYIKELFDSDGIKAPESLSEENMLAMLEASDEAQPAGQEAGSGHDEKKHENRRAKSFPSLKRIAAAAAVALVALFGVSGLTEIITAPPDTSEVNGELYTFKNEKEIQKLLKSMDTGSRFKLFNAGEEEMIEYESSTADGSAADTAAPGNALTGKSSDGGHSETYLQVDEVDEADIVKTDGKYIYCVTGSREVVILSAENGNTRQLSKIGSSGIENYINDIYVKGDKLITVGTIYREDSEEASSGIVIYDISDRSKPSVVRDFSQTGSILTSRMVGDYVYLVTNDPVYKGGRALPMCGSSDSFKNLDASGICCVPKPETSSYIVLSAIDIASEKQGNSTTKAILGASSEIYCNDHNLYLTSMEWPDGAESVYTRVVRASLDGINVKFNATAKVRGYVNNQFSMDERDGYFRIATTSERAGMDVNNLYVLDSSLKEAGKVTGFARNESIKAVRYVGDKAYVITYEAIDPLFIIDLSVPADPRIEGEVMIDGFSTLLIPVSEDRLLGIGHATGDNGYGGEFDSGLKLALFDISDPSQPAVLDSKEFENMSSPAQYDHHALMVNNDAGYFAVPYEVWNYSATDGDVISGNAKAETEASFENGILVFRAGDKITSVDQHSLDSSQLLRSVYIGEWIYALDADGTVKSFKPSF